MKRFKNYLPVLVTVSLLGLPPRGLSQEPVPGTFRTIDFPGAADTVECCSAILNINDEGQIVGGYMDASGTGHGFLLKGGMFTTIDFPGAVYTEALGMNARGQIVGEYIDAIKMASHGFLLTRRGFATVDPPGAINRYINWINQQGDMVGGYMDMDGSFHGVLVSRGAFMTIDFPGASNTFGLGINSRGEIVGGYVDSAGLNLHGFLMSNGKFNSFDFPGSNTDISACGGLGGGVSYTDGINDEGTIVGGYCGADGHLHGFLLSRKEMGNAEDSGASTDIGVFSTIDFPGAISSFASGINSEGKIVGGYQSADGHYHGFLLNRDQEWISSLGQPETSNENANSATLSDRANRLYNALPENVRSVLRQRLHLGRFGIPLMDQQ
jgi:probable HAF family extracellular repeat protein